MEKITATITDTNTDYFGIKVCLLVPEDLDPAKVQKGFDEMMTDLIGRANQLTIRDLYDMNQKLQRAMEAQMN